MRQIQRTDLDPVTANALQLLQREVDSQRASEDFNPESHWKGKRRSPLILAVHAVLKRMAGVRERCMYCLDSECSDIEHFWPKSPHSDRMYVWTNLLAACAQCGRFKGTKFPLASDGTPLLIDPSIEDPWEFLDFDPDTGNLNARWVLSEGGFSPKGEATVTALHLDKREGVSAGYRKTFNRLRKLVSDWNDNNLVGDYLEQLEAADDHGLLGWFLNGTGQNDPSFSRFRARHQNAWAACKNSLR